MYLSRCKLPKNQRSNSAHFESSSKYALREVTWIGSLSPSFKKSLMIPEGSCVKITSSMEFMMNSLCPYASDRQEDKSRD